MIKIDISVLGFVCLLKGFGSLDHITGLTTKLYLVFLEREGILTHEENCHELEQVYNNGSDDGKEMKGRYIPEDTKRPPPKQLKWLVTLIHLLLQS